jgi:hypothetical protein
MYHYIRGESFLKLYVLFNMLAAWWRNGLVYAEMVVFRDEAVQM